MNRCCWNDHTEPLCTNPALPGEGSLYCYWHFKKLVRDGLPPVDRDTCGTNAGYHAHKQRAERLCHSCRTWHEKDNAARTRGQRQRAIRQNRERQSA